MSINFEGVNKTTSSAESGISDADLEKSTEIYLSPEEKMSDADLKQQMEYEFRAFLEIQHKRWSEEKDIRDEIAYLKSSDKNGQEMTKNERVIHALIGLEPESMDKLPTLREDLIDGFKDAVYLFRQIWVGELPDNMRGRGKKAVEDLKRSSENEKTGWIQKLRENFAVRTLAELGASALLLMTISADPNMQQRPIDNTDSVAGVSDTAEHK